MMLVRRVVIMAVALCVAGLAGCSTDSSSIDTPMTGAPSDEPPFELVGPSAALGGDGDLVMLDVRSSQVIDPQLNGPVEGSPTATGAAIRRVAGTWSTLPDPPDLYAAELVSVGDTVAVVGFDCLGDPCDLGTPAGALLASDLGGWDPIDLGDIEPYNVYDTGVSPIGHNWAESGPGYWHFGDGSPLFVDRPDRDPEVNSLDAECPSGEGLVSVQLLEIEGDFDPARGFIQTPQSPLLFDTDEPDDGWVEGAPPPRVPLERPTVLCGADDLVLAGPDREVSFSYETERWIEHPTGLPAPVDANHPSIWSYALDDGSIVLLGHFYGTEAVEAGMDTSPVIIRHPDGRYEVTDTTVDALIVAGNTAYGLTNSEPDEFSLPVYRTVDIHRLDLGS